ncbi:helix-turn-helix transcriptional regulator [Aquirufa nivalisilvae]|uniref:helix-turn-helix transcriptional regulator n=1 Tax=Aquirufa nivalisilvae TaxID=2516557 RepID=UPI0022A98321|nr:helix-turn-helix transcriptional regulator [Aquirufa nivalisilvae]MCZ2479801.1 helix-turn-helix transcriptional regulator [Aquirufa nivalisilvae]
MKTKHLFSVALIKSRLSLQLTQQQVASAVGVSQSAYNYWESGKHYPNATKIFQLTKVLKIPLEEVMAS